MLEVEIVFNLEIQNYINIGYVKRTYTESIHMTFLAC